MLRAVLGAGVQLAKPRCARCCVDRRGEDLVSVFDFAQGGPPGAKAHNSSEGAEVVAERDACAYARGDQVMIYCCPYPHSRDLGLHLVIVLSFNGNVINSINESHSCMHARLIQSSLLLACQLISCCYSYTLTGCTVLCYAYCVLTVRATVLYVCTVAATAVEV